MAQSSLSSNIGWFGLDPNWRLVLKSLLHVLIRTHEEYFCRFKPRVECQQYNEWSPLSFFWGSSLVETSDHNRDDIHILPYPSISNLSIWFTERHNINQHNLWYFLLLITAQLPIVRWCSQLPSIFVGDNFQTIQDGDGYLMRGQATRSGLCHGWPWLVGGLEFGTCFFFPYIGNVIIPTD